MPARLRDLRYDLGYGLLRRVLRISPRPGLAFWQGVGRRLGTLLWWLARRERRRMLDHLRLAFPDADRQWRHRLARDCARHLGCLAGEVVWLWGVPPEELLARTTFRGLEHLDEGIRSHKGAVIITGHCGNWEWLNLALAARGTPLTVAVRALDDPRFDSIIRTLRGRFGGTSIGRGEGAGRALIAACHAGATIGLLIDQDIDAPGCFVEFFGTPAWTPTGAGVLARRSKRPIVPSFATRQPNGDMLLSFDPPIDPILSEDADQDARLLTVRLTARIEQQIRAHPEQWVWMHRRWRRRPEAGEEVLWQSATIAPHRPTGTGQVDPPAEVHGR
ncbi:MAG: lysophospholipid acyltransferase family protein [Acidobacteriota bacterium]